MVELIKKILKENKKVSYWKVTELKKTSSEMFFIKQKLDMNRSKNVTDYLVTVYVDFEEGGEHYLGQSTTKIGPMMTEEEIRAYVVDAATGASFVKNKFYSLAGPSQDSEEVLESDFDSDALMTWMPKIAGAVYQKDILEEAGINSSELFLNRIQKRIITSQGIDVSYEAYKGMVEVIAESEGEGEAVELYMMEEFGSFKPDLLSVRVDELLDTTRKRAEAIKTPSISNIPIILSGEAVRDFLHYYIRKSNALAIFEGTSDYQLAMHVQGDEVTGDLLTIDMVPVMSGSSLSKPYDDDGVLMKPVRVIEEGVLKSYIGDTQYASYLAMPVTGTLLNMSVASGTMKPDEMSAGPYVKLLSFSDFQVNTMTGDFGGEIRLAEYFDGETTRFITGGAISANIKDVHGTMKMSDEVIQYNWYQGPKYIYFKGMDISGEN